jgi:hypothetical protein
MRAGISYESFRLWRHKSSKNNERVEEALEEWCNALLTKIDEHGKKNVNALIFRLQTMFPARFAKPELLVQMANLQAGGQDATSGWLSAVGGSPIPQGLPQMTDAERELLALPEPMPVELPVQSARCSRWPRYKPRCRLRPGMGMTGDD